LKAVSRRIRPLFALVWVGLGAVAGNIMAEGYFARINSYLTGEGAEVFWFIPQNPTKLSSVDRIWLRVSFLLVGALLGFIVERLAFQQISSTRSRWEKMAPQDKLAYFAGIPLGLLITVLIRNILVTPDWITAALAVVLCYVSVAALDSLKEQIKFYFPASSVGGRTETTAMGKPKLLDTNVIIDGRISDICRAGFMEGPVYVPKFVLEELQLIADSGDSLKRARGRRGLEILNQMRKEMPLEVPEFASAGATGDVDTRLVIVARDIDAAIVTNDYNLNKVAELQGVQVLNINELANAVKPVVLPGEEMRVTIIKEGKEKEQGIAYLDDGTMVVVEGARRLIGDTMDIAVTSVLQTVQGKMIFGRIKEIGEGDSVGGDESVGAYTGGRPRRKTR